MANEQTKDPIINCHAHIFTGDQVPTFLARTFVPTPFYLFLPLNLFVFLFRCWYKGPATIPYKAWYKKLSKWYNNFQTGFSQLGFIRTLIEYYVAAHVFCIFYDFIKSILPPEKTFISRVVNDFCIWFDKYSLLFYFNNTWIKVLVVLLTFIFLPSARNLVVFIFKQLYAVLRKLPGKETKELLKRYLNIGRYAFHKDQGTILSRLKGQYPKGSGMVILPMDMEYMGAWRPPVRYRDQMEKLAELKAKKTNAKTIYPFVFADPRRMVEIKKEKRNRAGDKIYFDYTITAGKVELKDCFIKDFIDNTVKEKNFSGIKIYPALGYYPFDEKLLPLWVYAAEKGIPIMTHCVKGPMFYRGKKEMDWNYHPVFEQAMGKDDEAVDEKKLNWEEGEEESSTEDKKLTKYEKLALPQTKNGDFCANFTHPMNFLCLLEEELLRKVIANAVEKNKDTELRLLFGYKDENTPLAHTLTKLKICLAHYGGADQWLRYFEKDRYAYSNRLTKHPKGIQFLKKVNGESSKGKIEQLWKYTDWYSIISSMILQHENVYADISYILHNDAEMLPLLKQTLINPGLREKILFGTDFYVVRNHKSDKNMLATMMGGLDEKDFDVIARINPRKFLNLPDTPFTHATKKICDNS